MFGNFGKNRVFLNLIKATAKGFLFHLLDNLQAEETKPADPHIPPVSQHLPIVLHHGFAGFDSILGNDYFFNVKSYLEERGFNVFLTEVTALGKLEVRAQQLADRIDNVLKVTGQNKVHLICHSLGGLDARLLILQILRVKPPVPASRTA